MNVLITGGYNFVSRLTAERFYKEGCQIILMTDHGKDSSRETIYNGEILKNTLLRHDQFKCYHLDGDLEKYEWVFKSNKFDVVIHIENGQAESEARRFSQFANLVNLSMKYKIGQFVFVPLMKQKKESLYTFLNNVLIDSSKIINQGVDLGLTTIIPGDVYGPYARKETLEAQIGQYIQDAINGSGETFKPKKNTYYYIDDVVDAIYKVVAHKNIGVFELGKDTIQGWEPKYSLEAGLEKTVSWYKKNRDFWKIDEVVEKKSLLKRLEVLLPYGENILFFLITFLIAYQTKDNTFRYNVFPLDFNLIYIFLISVTYGMRQGIIAIFLACFSYVVVYLHISPDLAGIVYNQGHIIQLLIYVMVGIITAYVVDNKRRETENLKTELLAKEDKQNFIEEVCNQVTAIKDELQEQILNTDNSLGKIYDLTKELNSLLVEDVYYGAIHTLEKLLKTQSVAIYKCNKAQTFLRLMTHSKEWHNELSASLRIDEYKAITELFKTREIFINYELNKDLPMMMAPILHNNEVIAVAFIDDVPFESLTLYYENFFRVAIGLIQNAIVQALTYEAATIHERYIGEGPVVHMNYFNEMIKNKQRAKSQFNIPYTILTVKENKYSLESLAMAIQECIRETDYIGANKENEVYIMLSNSDLQHSQLIARRLSRKGIETMPYKGVSA